MAENIEVVDYLFCLNSSLTARVIVFLIWFQGMFFVEITVLFLLSGSSASKKYIKDFFT